MAHDLVIRNGHLVLPDRVERADLAIEDGKIVGLAPSISGSARSEIDATNLHVFPGLIDPHVHFNEPGRTEWEGFSTGSSALAAGGGTMFFDMPLNSSPPVLDGESFDLKLAAASKNSFTDFALWGGTSTCIARRVTAGPSFPTKPSSESSGWWPRRATGRRSTSWRE